MMYYFLVVRHHGRDISNSMKEAGISKFRTTRILLTPIIFDLLSSSCHVAKVEENMEAGLTNIIGF